MACAVWKAREVDYFQLKYMSNCKGVGGEGQFMHCLLRFG